MCEADAFWIKDGREELIMESVDIAEPEDAKTWRLVNVFGDQKTVKGQIVKMNLVDHKILFQP